MSERRVAPYGSWRSPISSDVIVRGVVGLKQVVIDGANVYWLESRPGEGGRNVVVLLRPDGRTEDVTPQPFNARTRVHEYGGGDFTADRGTVYFSNFADQRIYYLVPGDEPASRLAGVEPSEHALGRHGACGLRSRRRRVPRERRADRRRTG